MLAINTVENAVPRHELIMSLVQERKARQIGRGYFGTVFSAPKEKGVIKVCRDSAYLAFIAAIIKFQNNPWFPRIYSATLYYPEDDPWYLVVEMERLTKGSNAQLRACLSLLDANLNDILLIGQALHVPRPRMRNLVEMQRLLKRLFKMYGPDFHKGNIMFRRLHPVIIDPVVSGDGTMQS